MKWESAYFWMSIVKHLAPAPHDARSVVDMALAIHPVAQAEPAQELDGAPLEHPGPHPSEHVVLAGALDDHRVDPDSVEGVRQERSRRARSDDRDVRGERHVHGLQDC